MLPCLHHRVAQASGSPQTAAVTTPSPVQKCVEFGFPVEACIEAYSIFASLVRTNNP